MGTLGENIRMMRESMGLSQTELGDKIGVTRSCISFWEKGTTSPKMGKLEKLAGVFGVKVSVLLDDGFVGNLTTQERQLLESFRKLDDTTKRIALLSVIAMAGDRK